MFRFYAPAANKAGIKVVLPTEEAHHLKRVLRLETGALVQVFDGRGHEHSATVVETGGSGASVLTESAIATATEPRVHITLAMSLLKGRKMDAVVRDATMLGISRFQPLVTTHTESPSIQLERNAKNLNRWTRVAVSSTKQCGRSIVPRIEAPLGFEQFINTHELPNEMRALFVEPQLSDDNHGLQSMHTLSKETLPKSAIITIGPEGGWTSVELDMAKTQGFSLWTFGGRTFRSDVLPVAILSVLNFIWSDYKNF